MAERLRRSTRMVWYHGLGCEPPGTIITLLSNSERSVGSIPTRRVLHVFIFATFLWRRGEGKEGRKKGRDKGVKTFFCSLWGVDVSLRAERAAGAKKVFLFVLLRGCSRRIFLYWTRRGEEHGAREETTSRGRFFGGERRGALERGSSAVSPTPFSRECLVRVLWGTTVPFAAALFWPFGGGWLRERKAAAWKTRKGKSRSQLEVEKKEETSLFVSSFHSLHPSFLVQQQQQQHETACSAPPLNFRMLPA